MKKQLTKRMIALCLTMAMLLSGLTMMAPSVQAETTGNTTGTAAVYDIYDLTGSKTNTFNGTGNGNWSASVFGNMDAADKENFSIKAKVKITDGNEWRLSTAALDSKDCVDVTGYGLVLHFGMSKLIFARNGNWDISWDMNNADMMGEYELEFGYRDILLDGNRIGKQIFVKKNGEILHTYDNMNDYLTGDALGTKVALFHYGTAVQMDTTYETSYGSAKAYDIYDLTGSETNTFNGTGNGNWSASVFGNMDAADKENFSIKAKVNITDGSEWRLSTAALDSKDCVDVTGYGLVLHFGMSKLIFARNGNWDISWDMNNADMMGEYELEFGYQDILFGGKRIGKQIFVKKNGEILHTYDNLNDYLTGDALGTKVALFHYGTAVQMDTTYDNEVVYDIFDLTGVARNSIAGAKADKWTATVLGNVDAADKENVSVKANVSIIDGYEHRLSLGAKESDDCLDVRGYGLILDFKKSKLIFARAGNWIVQWDINNADWMGDYELEFGYRDILEMNQPVGKQIFVKKNGVVLYTYDDTNGYLTGDALGTKAALFHYGRVVQMDTTYECGYGTVNAYDIYDLNGGHLNTINGTGNGNWSATLLGHTSSAHKENISFKADVNFPYGNEYRLSLAALDSNDCVNIAGYGLVLHFGMSKLIFARAGNWIVSWDINNADWMGEYELEFGYRDILVNNQTIGKQLFVKKNGAVLYTYDDVAGYLTGDALGTKTAIFHYSTAAQMDTTYSYSYGSENVYDISDLTNSETNTINGAGNGNWLATVFGNTDAAHKENVFLKANVNITNVSDTAKYRFSLGALETDDCVDPAGYGMEIKIGKDDGYVALIRGSSHQWLTSWSGDTTGLQGQHQMVFGYRDILVNGRVCGKQIVLAVDGVILYTYNDYNGYLTGDALGTKAAIFHYDSTIQMDAAKECIHPYTTETTYPDCLNAGKTVYTCIVCGHSYEETIAPTGHTPVVDVAVAPACGKTGLTEGQHCFTCGVVLVAQQEVAALAHTETTNTEHTVAADCESTGWTNFTHCSVCNYVIEPQKVDPALGHTEVTDAAVAPDCENTGLTEGSHCSACGKVFVAQETIPANGHSWVRAAYDATESEKPYLMDTCSVCNATGEKLYLRFSAVNVTLSNDLSVNFHVSEELLADGAYTDMYAIFEMGYRVGEYQLRREPVKIGERYRFVCDGITPSQIGDQITVTLYATYNGKQYSIDTTYSIVDYCKSKLEDANSSAQLKTLLVDMLNYGAAARTYAGYTPPNGEPMPNAFLTDAQKALGTAANPSLTSKLNASYNTVENPVVSWKSAGVVLRNSVFIRVRFYYEGDVNALTLKMKVGDGAEAAAVKIEADSTRDNQYYATFSGVPAKQMRDLLQITAYNGTTAVSNTLAYSIESYAYAKQNDADSKLVDLVIAMMKYGDAAANYFE